MPSKYLHFFNLWNLFLVIYTRNLYMISTFATIHVSKYNGKIFKCNTYIHTYTYIYNIKLQFYYQELLEI